MAVVAMALMLVALPAAMPAAVSSPETTPPPVATAEAGALQLVSRTVVSEREVDLTFTTPALAAPTTARAILPAGYDPASAARYPVLYLLHGGNGRYTNWAGVAGSLTHGLPLITVLPDGGRSAWYTNWYNNGLGGTPAWETYHVDQLLPWIDANFNTIGTRSGRAIAGLSSGGFGALSYASRHPDLFVAAAGFSAALDTNTPPTVAGKVIDVLAAQDGGGPGSLFGLRETEEVRWRGSNPWDLATNLQDMELHVRAGNGEAGGEYGGGGVTDPGGYALEKATYDMSVSFHNRLDALGIEHVWDDYGPGTHNFDYWRRDLRLTLPLFMDIFSEARPDPAKFSYRTIRPTYRIYGWDVAIDRDVLEFSSIDDASTAGFVLRGSGTAQVTTPPAYQRNRPYTVSIRGLMQRVRADTAGRLHLQVPLGPSNVVQQQFLPTHASPATTEFTTRVEIRR